MELQVIVRGGVPVHTLRANCTSTLTTTALRCHTSTVPVCFGLRNHFGTCSHCITIASYCSYLARLVNGTSLPDHVRLWCSCDPSLGFEASRRYSEESLGLLLSSLVRKHDLVCATTHFSSSHECKPVLAISSAGIIAIQSKKCVR